MDQALEIAPRNGAINGQIRPPGSKSITNRALLLAALARGECRLSGALHSDDTRVMLDSLQQLGIQIDVNVSAEQIVVQGCGGRFPNTEASLFVENSGTTIRFLTAVLGIHGGKYRLDGVERMRERPIGPLVEALNHLNASVVAESPQQSPPVSIDSPLATGRSVKVRGNLSSQYLSGLLMAAPLCPHGLVIEIEGELVSKPYVAMTVSMMNSFGVSCIANSQLTRFEIPAGQTYQARHYSIEPDASAASYFWAAAAICGGTAQVMGLTQHSLQGDVRFVEVLKQMGCEVSYGQDSISVTGPAQFGIDVDMSDISDTVQTLAAVAAFVSGPTTVRNVAHNRIKETDRIAFLAVELRKLGLQVTEFPDGLKIDPAPLLGTTPALLGTTPALQGTTPALQDAMPGLQDAMPALQDAMPGLQDAMPGLRGAKFETYQDHRMAMSLALFGLRVPGVVILNPSCVSKTYPDYFQDLEKFCNSNR